VLVVSPDERWLRVLEVTVRLGGHRTVSRRSVPDALRVREGDVAPRAVVIDLRARWSSDEVDAVRALLEGSTVPAIVILPERLESERDRVASAGATVLISPYRPSELYAALAPEAATSSDAAGAAATPGDAGAAPPGAPTADGGDAGAPPRPSGEPATGTGTQG
jgi:DNA-binding response OmpR family regulator